MTMPVRWLDVIPASRAKETRDERLLTQRMSLAPYAGTCAPLDQELTLMAAPEREQIGKPESWTHENSIGCNEDSAAIFPQRQVDVALSSVPCVPDIAGDSGSIADILA